MFSHVLLLALTLGNLVAAYPWMDPAYKGPRPGDKSFNAKKWNYDGGHAEKRQLGLDIPGALSGAGGLLSGLLGAVAQNVAGGDKVPDAAHPYQAPGPTDQRGPCPGLNTLANHGYISRSGIVTAGEVIDGTAKGFNMAADLSTLLITVAIAFGGNIETEVFSLGGEDDRTYSASGIGSKAAGRQYGLDGHSRCEGDISATRRDYYLNSGDNHNAYPDRFKRFIDLAKSNGNQFNLAAANQLYGQNAQESIASNPQLFFNSYTIIVILGEYPFIPNFMSNGTYGAGGVANYESISSIYGMQANADGSICYVPERFPENWYRRSTSYGVVDLVAGLAPTYLTGPELVLPNPLGILQNGAQTSQIGCALYQGITSGIPAALLGETNDYISAAVTYVQSKLTPTIPSLYGCSPSQPSLQENSTGGGQYSTGTAGDSQAYGNICA